MIFHHKNIRLSRDNYLGTGWFFVTICCANRQKLFAKSRTCEWLLNTLRRHSAKHGFAIHAYCIMPDHVHLLLEGLQPDSDLLRMMRAFKKTTSATFVKKKAQPLWQKKFYDHILRNEDSPDAVAWYIWANPVRAGLAKRPQDYPFVGSFTGKFGDSAYLLPDWSPPWKQRITPVADRRIQRT